MEATTTITLTTQEALNLGIVGLFIVFTALTLISLFIAGFSRLVAKFEAGELNFVHKLADKTKKEPGEYIDDINNGEENGELVAAIAVALSACLQTEQAVISFEQAQEEATSSSWAIAGRLKLMERVR